MRIDWTDAESIALLLQKSYPDVDPRELELAELTQMLEALPGAHGEVARWEEKLLEAVQEAWNEEYADDQS